MRVSALKIDVSSLCNSNGRLKRVRATPTAASATVTESPHRLTPSSYQNTISPLQRRGEVYSSSTARLQLERLLPPYSRVIDQSVSAKGKTRARESLKEPDVS